MCLAMWTKCLRRITGGTGKWTSRQMPRPMPIPGTERQTWKCSRDITGQNGQITFISSDCILTNSRTKSGTEKIQEEDFLNFQLLIFPNYPLITLPLRFNHITATATHVPA